MAETWTEINAHWKGEMVFAATNQKGASIQVGDLGDKPGIGPMQLLLVSLAACTGMDIVSILRKKRVNLSDFQVRVRALRAEDYPMVFTEIHVEYLLWGEDFKAHDIEQAIQLSEDKYCSVGIMLRKAAPVHTSYRTLHPGETA